MPSNEPANLINIALLGVQAVMHVPQTFTKLVRQVELKTDFCDLSVLLLMPAYKNSILLAKPMDKRLPALPINNVISQLPC